MYLCSLDLGSLVILRYFSVYQILDAVTALWFLISGSWISCHLEVFFSLSDYGCCYGIMICDLWILDRLSSWGIFQFIRFWMLLQHYDLWSLDLGSLVILRYFSVYQILDAVAASWFLISGSWTSCHLEVFLSLSDSGCCYSIMICDLWILDLVSSWGIFQFIKFWMLLQHYDFW